jgi:hypothetical protein
MSQADVAAAAQKALLGEVPPSLRFVVVSLDQDVLHFRAVFDHSTTDEHLECARVACTEILAACPGNTKLDESIEVDDGAKWPKSISLVYLRHGELSDT